MKRIYKLSLVFLLFLLPALACGGSEPAVIPTAVATSPPIPTVTPGGSNLNSPRDGGGSGLPATFTPEPSPAPATAAPAATAAGSGSSGDERTYTVQAGDTLGEIADQFGVSLEDLIEINNIEDIDVIEVGQVLIIPE